MTTSSDEEGRTVVTSKGDRRLLELPGEVQQAASIAFLRIFLGIMWLFEVTVGHNWKIGGFASGAHPGWWGSGAGDAIREDVAEAVADGTWAWVAWFYESLVAPNATAFNYLIIALQVTLGIAFIVGFMVRPLAIAAIAFDLSVFMLGNSRIPPFFTAMHLFVLATGAGRYYGVDGWMLKQVEGTRSTVAKVWGWLIELPIFSPRMRIPVVAFAAFTALYFFMQIPMRATPRMGLVAMELAFLAGLVAVAMYATSLIPERLQLLAATVRIFVGFKFLHEIWVRTEPGVNALPGWAGGEAIAELFATVSENHWALFAWIADTVFIPYATFWAIVFGAVQFAVGVALLVGWRTRAFSLLGAAYVGGLMIMGMTRYAPFVLGLLVPIIALDAGRVLSLDSLTARVRQPHYGLPIPQRLVVPLLVLAAVNAVAATVTAFTLGIEPDAYVTSMPSMTTAMVAIFSGLLALVGWLQRHPPIVLPEAREDIERRPELPV
jgi:hypothetical protein